MTKGREDIKARLKALRVNEPLKLNGGMRPPLPGKEEVPQTEAPRNKPVANEVPQKEQTQIELVEPKMGVHTERPQNVQPPSEPAQNEKPTNEEPCSEPPQKQHAQTEGTHREGSPPQGFFKLSHSVFSEPLLRDLSGDCFRLFLWLSSRAWRYPTSTGQVRASVGFIELHAGMSHATISRGLKTLKEKGLIAIVEVDYKNGNLWQVSALASGHPGNDDKPPRSRVTQNEAAQTVDLATSKSGSKPLKLRGQPPQNEQDLRSFKKVKKLKEVAGARIRLPEPERDSPIHNTAELLRSFESELGHEEQSKLVNDFMTREYPHGFFPPIRVIRALVAREWFSGGQSARPVAC